MPQDYIKRRYKTSKALSEETTDFLFRLNAYGFSWRILSELSGVCLYTMYFAVSGKNRPEKITRDKINAFVERAKQYKIMDFLGGK